MSYLSAPENVGFSGIPQNISDASCATQYKMAVEGVAGSGEVNMYTQDSSGDEQSYITHLNDNFFHTKFKIDPNELYTFHDSDVIAGEITVGHSEDAFIFPDNVDVKNKLLESPCKEVETITNGDVKEEIKTEVMNGHYSSAFSSPTNFKSADKVHKGKKQVAKEQSITNSVVDVRRSSVQSPKRRNTSASPSSNKSSISNSSNVTPVSKLPVPETFMDVFKREQGFDNLATTIKTEPSIQTLTKVSFPTPKKPHIGKAPPQTKARKGRGPAVHEALQRIPPRRAVPVPIKAWHAPGEELFECGPLIDKKPSFKQIESGSSDDDNIPDFETEYGAVCVEETAAESRGARLALRRAALRRKVACVGAQLRLASAHRQPKALATLLQKQLKNKDGIGNLSAPTVNHLLTMRGMPSLMSSQERRQLRESGWSGGESGSLDKGTNSSSCAEERCTSVPLPCGRYCLAHVTLAPEQRLYAACAAVFAGGERCKHPLLPLHEQTPLCAEHAWKRDNYDKLSRDCRPKKAVRKRVWAAPVRPPRRAKRRRRPAPRPRAPPTDTPTNMHPPTTDQSLTEINVCSNSSAYDSSEDTTMGALSETEYVTVATDSCELEVEVEQVPHDELLDPSVLSQIPDEAFTEFFNQAEGETTFEESSELAAALEAVLDERGLEENINDSVFIHSAHAQLKNKIQVSATPVAMEMSSPAPS